MPKPTAERLDKIIDFIKYEAGRRMTISNFGQKKYEDKNSNGSI